MIDEIWKSPIASSSSCVSPIYFRQYHTGPIWWCWRPWSAYLTIESAMCGSGKIQSTVPPWFHKSIHITTYPTNLCFIGRSSGPRFSNTCFGREQFGITGIGFNGVTQPTVSTLKETEASTLYAVKYTFIITLAASSGKHNVMVWHPSVRLSHCPVGLCSTWLTRGQHATRPAYDTDAS